MQTLHFADSRSRRVHFDRPLVLNIQLGGHYNIVITVGDRKQILKFMRFNVGRLAAIQCLVRPLNLLQSLDEPSDGKVLRVVHLELGPLFELTLPVAREPVVIAQCLNARLVVHSILSIALILIASAVLLALKSQILVIRTRVGVKTGQTHVVAAVALHRETTRAVALRLLRLVYEPGSGVLALLLL